MLNVISRGSVSLFCIKATRLVGKMSGVWSIDCRHWLNNYCLIYFLQKSSTCINHQIVCSCDTELMELMIMADITWGAFSAKCEHNGCGMSNMVCWTEGDIMILNTFNWKQKNSIFKFILGQTCLFRSMIKLGLPKTDYSCMPNKFTTKWKIFSTFYDTEKRNMFLNND